MGVVFEKGFRVVGRAVVDGDDFEMGISLVNDGIETFWKIFGGVVDGDDDGNFSFGFSFCWHGFCPPLGWLFDRKRGGRRKNSLKTSRRC